MTNNEDLKKIIKGKEGMTLRKAEHISVKLGKKVGFIGRAKSIRPVLLSD